MEDAVRPPEGSQVLNLKPKQTSFMLRRILIGAAVSLILGLITVGVFLLLGLNPLPSIFVFAAALAVAWYAALVAYRKERYEIHGDRVLCHRGGLFGDETTELELRNVTHLKIMLPWLRHKFFGIGHVMVESAGNSKPIMMFALPNPKETYEQLTLRLKDNGFDLKQEQLLHEEQPAVVGVVLDVLGLLVGLGAFALFIFPTILMVITEADSVLMASLISGLLLLAFAAFLFFVVIHALDLRRRNYRVYNDVVVYEEGFLTRNNALIPYENIADASTKRTLVDRIFGIFDVTISCQGGGAEIKFRHLTRGDDLSATIDTLVANASRKPKWKPQGKVAAEQRPSREKPAHAHDGPLITGDYSMDSARVFLPALILLPIFPVFVLVMIGLVIRKCGTTYSLKGDSVRYHFSFLSSNSREFAYDKVTGVVVKRNLLDWIMGTMSLKFWSIGSSQAIEFQYLKKNDIDVKMLLGQLGVPPADAAPCRPAVSFGLGVWLKARLNLLPLLVLLTAFAALFATAAESGMVFMLFMGAYAVVVAAWLIHGYLYYPRQQLLFYPHHVEAIQGIITTSHYYACYHNIKRRKVTCYPGSISGSLEIFVAGEQMVGSSGGQNSDKKAGVVRQCSFTTGFLADAAGAGELLDDILCGRVDPEPGATSAEPMEGLIEAPRSVKSAVVRAILVSVLLFPLLLVLPFTLIWLWISIPKWRYRMDLVRIISERGVFYKTRETILLDRVDSLQQNQGPIHKLCSNGNVSIMTAGSSKPDLRIVDCPDYRKVYEMVRDHSQ